MTSGRTITIRYDANGNKLNEHKYSPDEWKRKQRENLSRWKTAYGNNLEKIRKAQTNIQSLDEQINKSNSAAHREKLNGWKLGIEKQINEINGWNFELANKYKSVKSKMNLNTYNSMDASPLIGDGLQNRPLTNSGSINAPGTFIKPFCPVSKEQAIVDQFKRDFHDKEYGAMASGFLSFIFKK